MEATKVEVRLVINATLIVEVPANAPNKNDLAEKIALARIQAVEQLDGNTDQSAFENYLSEIEDENIGIDEAGKFWDKCKIENISSATGIVYSIYGNEKRWQ